MALPTKIQYKSFEPGEFTGKKERTYEETIGLIENFPWEAQRDHLQVNLTNPSITIEDNKDNFLKLAVYYENKFVLHYLNGENRLYTKSLLRYEQAYPYLQSFFEDASFNTADFKLETNWLQGKAIHFKDQDFHYQLNPIKFWMQIALWIALLLFYLFNLAALSFSLPDNKALGVFVILFLFFIAILGFHMAVLFNHYRMTRGKTLVISKGNDLFYYGDRDHPEQYDKKDITKVIIVGPRNARNRSATYVSLEMGLSATRYLNISSMLINKTQLLNKLTGHSQLQKNKWFPLIPPSA